MFYWNILNQGPGFNIFVIFFSCYILNYAVLSRGNNSGESEPHVCLVTGWAKAQCSLVRSKI